jgi:hypothetical protein
MKQTTEELLQQQIQEVIEKNEMHEQIKKLTTKAINSGALNRADIESGLRPALMLLVAILETIAEELKPRNPDRKYNSELNNIKKLI